MRTNPVVVSATDEHAVALAPRLRMIDCTEIREDRDPLAVVRDSLARSTHAWTWLVDGVPVCMWGVAPRSILGGAAWVWFLASDAIIDCDRRTFLVGSRAIVRSLLDIYPRLEGYVDERFAPSVRWIRKMGFRLGARFVHPAGVPFCHFVKER